MINQNEERLQKALARAGIASRRSSEDLIAAGRVKVNGKVVTQLGTKINPAQDRVTVDDEPIGIRANAAPQKVYLMLNKPQGYLSTVRDPQGRPTVMDLLGEEQMGRLYPVGRLDADSEGLILLTNDGTFAQTMSHPRYEVEKEYIALLDGIVAMKDIEALRNGVSIRVEDPETGEHSNVVTLPAKVDLVRHEGSNSLVRFILKEGKKRQIRLMAQAVEHPVVELKRVRLGPTRLGDLPSGKYRPLSKVEVHALVESARQKGTANPAASQSAEPARANQRPARSGRPGNFQEQRAEGRPFQRDSSPDRDRPGRSERGASPDRDRAARPERGVAPDRDRTGRPERGVTPDRDRPDRPERRGGRVRPFESPDAPSRKRGPGRPASPAPGRANRTGPADSSRRSGPPRSRTDRPGPGRPGRG